MCTDTDRVLYIEACAASYSFFHSSLSALISATECQGTFEAPVY